MDVLKTNYSPASHLSLSPTLGDSDEGPHDVKSASSGASPAFQYDVGGLRPETLGLDQFGNAVVGYPQSATFLNYGVLRNQDFAIAAPPLNSAAPQYFYAPASMTLPLSFAPMPSNGPMYFNAGPVQFNMPQQRPQIPMGGWNPHPTHLDDLSPEKYKQLANEFIARDDVHSTPSPNPEQMYQGMQTNRQTPSASTITSSFLEFEPSEPSVPLYRATSGSASSAATSYMQNNYEFQFTYETPPMVQSVSRDASQDPPLRVAPLSEDGRSVQDMDDEGVGESTEEAGNDDDDDAYVDPSSRKSSSRRSHRKPSRSGKKTEAGQPPSIDTRVPRSVARTASKVSTASRDSPRSPSSSTTPTAASAGRRPNGTYSCPDCGKNFKQNGHMRRHRRSHDGDESRIHACPIIGCDNKYYRRDHLRRHFQAHMSAETKARGSPPDLDENLASQMWGDK